MFAMVPLFLLGIYFSENYLKMEEARVPNNGRLSQLPGLTHLVTGHAYTSCSEVWLFNVRHGAALSS
jgi:hypothetical protein